MEQKKSKKSKKSNNVEQKDFKVLLNNNKKAHVFQH
jgi:hypothetical protein